MHGLKTSPALTLTALCGRCRVCDVDAAAALHLHSSPAPAHHITSTGSSPHHVHRQLTTSRPQAAHHITSTASSPHHEQHTVEGACVGRGLVPKGHGMRSGLSFSLTLRKSVQNTAKDVRLASRLLLKWRAHAMTFGFIPPAPWSNDKNEKFKLPVVEETHPRDDAARLGLCVLTQGWVCVFSRARLGLCVLTGKAGSVCSHGQGWVCVFSRTPRVACGRVLPGAGKGQMVLQRTLAAQRSPCKLSSWVTQNLAAIRPAWVHETGTLTWTRHCRSRGSTGRRHWPGTDHRWSTVMGKAERKCSMPSCKLQV